MIVCDERFRYWLEGKVGTTLPEDAQFIGRIVDGKVVAAVSFSHWTGHDIELSVAALPGAGSRALLRAIFQYVFDQLDCVRCTARIRASNEKSLSLAERIGFRREGVLRNGYGNEDAVILGLLRNEDVFWRKQATSGA